MGDLSHFGCTCLRVFETIHPISIGALMSNIAEQRDAAVVHVYDLSTTDHLQRNNTINNHSISNDVAWCK
jgi:hypothetical protein